MFIKSYTIKDIARALNLSTSTVSRALNGSYEISADTKKRVLEYAKTINYKPNPIALSLKEQKSHSIGVVVCEVANNYFSQAINGIEAVAYDRGYHVIITQTHESCNREAVNVQHLLSRHVDGLLISLSAETVDTALFADLHKKKYPLVFFDRVAADIDTHRVTANSFKGSFEATELLIRSGFTKIAHLTNSNNLLISRERLHGFKAAHEENVLSFIPEYLKYCEHGGVIQEEVEIAVTDLMNLSDPPQAIFIASDRLTIGCLNIFNKLGIKVPDRVAVVGFTNSDVAELFDPPLTVVRQPAFEMGQMATELLIKTIESKRPVEENIVKQLETELIVRSSSRRHGDSFCFC